MIGQKQDQGHIVVGLDVGTTRVCAVIGEVVEEAVKVIGIGTHATSGLRKGVVVDIEATVLSIKKAVEGAELMAGLDVTTVSVSIAGEHIQSLSSLGVIGIKGHEVTESDVDRVIDAATAVAIPTDREVLHILPQEFIVDENGGILDPRGMDGTRLEAKINIITGAAANIRNLVKCCNRAGLDVTEVVLAPLAAAEAVVTADEKKLGCVVVDFGGGTTDLAVFCGHTTRHTATVPLGGESITRDISIGLRTPEESAELVKVRYASCLAARIKREETIEVESTGGRRPRVLSRQILGEITEPRVEEIIGLAERELSRSGTRELASAGGVILSGGSALMDGLVELGEQVFSMPCRVGRPLGISGLKEVIDSPAYATAVGLVLFGAFGRPGHTIPPSPKAGLAKLIAKVKNWFTETM